MSENFTAFRTVFIGNLKNFGKEKKFSEDSAKLKKAFNLKLYEMVYLQKGLFEQRSCIVFLLFFLCSRCVPHFGQSPYLHLYFCVHLFLEYFPNLTIFSCPHLGHVILVLVGGDLLLNGGSPQMSFKIFIIKYNFKNYKKVNTTFILRG